jgi:hypothetical protein
VAAGRSALPPEDQKIVNVKAAALCVVAPAGAMGAGALLQQSLLSVWPAVQSLSVLGVSLDSYIADAAILGLCFLAGRLIRRNAPARGVLLASFLFPVLWLILLLLMMLPPNHMTGPIRLSFLVAAVAPILSLALAYTLPANSARSGPDRQDG